MMHVIINIIQLLTRILIFFQILKISELPKNNLKAKK